MFWIIVIFCYMSGGVPVRGDENRTVNLNCHRRKIMDIKFPRRTV